MVGMGGASPEPTWPPHNPEQLQAPEWGEPSFPREGTPLLTKDAETGQILPEKAQKVIEEENPKEQKAKIAEYEEAPFMSFQVAGPLGLYILVSAVKVLCIKASFHLLGDWLMGNLVFIFIGQAALIFAYLSEQSNKTEEELAAQPAWDLWEGTVKWRLALSSANELAKNILFFYALSKLPASEVALFLCMDIIFVSLMNVFYRGRELPFNRLIGVSLVTAAVFTSGTAHMLLSHDHATAQGSVVDITNPHLFALSMVLLRSFLSACQQFVDERLTQTDKVPAMFIAGTHGVLVVPVLLLGLMAIGPSIGPKYELGNIFNTFCGSSLTLGLSFLLIVTGAGDHYLNKLGLKKAGALGRTVAKSMRPTMVWILSILLAQMVPWLGGETVNAESGWHVLALVLQYAGALIYAGQCGFDK